MKTVAEALVGDLANQTLYGRLSESIDQLKGNLP
jgi:hypothetical protein